MLSTTTTSGNDIPPQGVLRLYVVVIERLNIGVFDVK